MIIYAQDGTQHKYRFVSINDEFLTCRNDNDEQFQYELAKVGKIVITKAGKYAKEWRYGVLSVGLLEEPFSPLQPILLDSIPPPVDILRLQASVQSLEP